MADYNYTIADEDDDIFKVTMGESTRRTVEQEEDDDVLEFGYASQ